MISLETASIINGVMTRLFEDGNFKEVKRTWIQLVN